MNKAVFLDRDGVINKELGDYVTAWDEFEFTQDIFKHLRKLQDNGFLLIVITNQGGVEKGRYSMETAVEILENMCAALKNEGIQITEYYFSPHHSDHSNSIDRKPDSIMLEKGIARFNVDVTKSYMIGDSERDIVAGNKVGLQSIKVDSNQNLSDIVEQIVTNV